MLDVSKGFQQPGENQCSDWERGKSHLTHALAIGNVVLTTQTRLRLQSILHRMASGRNVSLNERIELQKFADRDQTVATWLKRARRRQSQQNGVSPEDPLLDNLDLGTSEPDGAFRPGEDDLGDWFSGAPSWLRRS